jgi:hypothetical protein
VRGDIRSQLSSIDEQPAKGHVHSNDRFYKRQASGQVKCGPQWRCDWQPAALRELVVRKQSPPDPHAGPARYAAPARDRGFDGVAGGEVEAMQPPSGASREGAAVRQASGDAGEYELGTVAQANPRVPAWRQPPPAAPSQLLT